MKFLRFVGIVMLVWMNSNPLFAANNKCITQYRSVPFQDVLIKPNCFLQANYIFGDNPIIFCLINVTDNVNIGKITWTYKGKIKSGVLPIFLTDNADFQGEFADAKGSLSIRNNISTGIAVSCYFAS